MKTGDKVVCVDDGPCKTCGQIYAGLHAGIIYIPKYIAQSELVYMIGIKFPCACGNDGVAIERFRLLDELKAESKQRQNSTNESINTK